MSGPSRATRGDMTANRASPLDERSISWSDYREEIGKKQDRLAAMQLISAATGYVPLPHQARFHASNARHKLLCGGVGSGKTIASVAESVAMAILNPGANIALVSPTFDSVVNILLPEWQRICDALAKMGCPLQKNYVKSMAKSNMISGGYALFRSFDRVDNLRGLTLASCSIDESEVSRHPDYVFNTLNARLRATDANILQMHVTTTPKGLRGVPLMFHERRQLGKQDAWWTGRATSMTNHHLPDGFIDALKAGYSKRAFAQEVEGKLLRPSNTVFGEWNRGTHVRPWTYDRSLPYDLACDWGFANPYFCWIQRLPDGTAIVFDEYCENEVPIEFQKREIIKRCRELGKDPENIAGDRAVKNMNAWAVHTFPRSYFHRMRSTEEQDVMNGIEIIRNLIDPFEGEPRLFISTAIMDSQNPRGMRNMFESYRWKLNREGLLTDVPYKCNIVDHAADALRYMCVAVYSDKPKAFVLGNRDDIFAKKRRSRR